MGLKLGKDGRVACKFDGVIEESVDCVQMAARVDN